jgi:hypothetical protein
VFKRADALFSIFLQAFSVKPVSTSSQRDYHQSIFKSDLINEYKCLSPASPNHIKCMMTGYVLRKDKVIASHLIALAHESILRVLSYPPAFKWNPKNGLLLCQSIDKAFENMEITFLFNIQTSIITMQVLYDDLLMKSVFTQDDFNFVQGYDDMSKKRKKKFRQIMSELTFGDLDGKQLILPPLVFPSRRILLWVAKSAYENAMGDIRPHNCATASCPSTEEWEAMQNHIITVSPECTVLNVLNHNSSQSSDGGENFDF